MSAIKFITRFKSFGGKRTTASIKNFTTIPTSFVSIVKSSLVVRINLIESLRPTNVKLLSAVCKNNQVGPRRQLSTLSSKQEDKRKVTARNKEEQLIKMASAASTSSTDLQTKTNSNNNVIKPETDDKIIWIDCEMTGLDIETDVLMEVACIITDSNLHEIARQSNIILHVSDEVLNSMPTWCVQHHGESGLTEDCKKSTITTPQAESMLIDFVTKYTTPGGCPVGGNSVYMDRMFLQKYMPKLYSHFHYRSIDVSSLKELIRRWYPKEYNSAPKKRFIHRTIEDIEDSINELKFYRAATFKKP